MRIVGKEKQLPLARSKGLLIEGVDSEKVIYDEKTKQAHCLAPLAAIVFSHCDGNTSTDELARIASNRLSQHVCEEDAHEAVSQLGERGLLASAQPIRISRREMVRKSAVFGAAAAAATMIVSVEPPVAWAAACNTGAFCSSSAQCSGSCTGGLHCRCQTNKTCGCS